MLKRVHYRIPIGNQPATRKGKTFSSLSLADLEVPQVLDQLHITPMHDLFPLLLHPDFRQGASDAQDCFLEDYAPAPLTEDEMINEVDICVSRRSVEQSDMGTAYCPPYLYWLGYVYGLVNEGFTYDSQLEQYTPTSRRCGPLPALLNDSHFHKGVSLAQECFLECYAPAPLTLDEMISEIEDGLSRRAVDGDKVAIEEFGSAPSYIHRLGFVFGTINEGLTYAEHVRGISL